MMRGRWRDPVADDGGRAAQRAVALHTFAYRTGDDVSVSGIGPAGTAAGPPAATARLTPPATCP